MKSCEDLVPNQDQGQADSFDLNVLCQSVDDNLSRIDSNLSWNLGGPLAATAKLQGACNEATACIWCDSRGDVPLAAVKSIPPNTDNWLRKLYNYSMNNDKSTDKHETNHINNKCNDMNNDTRNMHITWAWTQARTLSHSLMLCHMHLVAQVWVSSQSSA